MSRNILIQYFISENFSLFNFLLLYLLLSLQACACIRTMNDTFRCVRWDFPMMSKIVVCLCRLHSHRAADYRRKERLNWRRRSAWRTLLSAGTSPALDGDCPNSRSAPQLSQSTITSVLLRLVKATLTFQSVPVSVLLQQPQPQ